MRRLSIPRGAVAMALRSLALVASAAVAASLEAQMPGVPVLQNAFGNPGLAGALNVGSGSSTRTVGVAGSFGVRGGNIVLSGGLGAAQIADSHTGLAGGVRASWSFLRFFNDQIGVAAFGGVGGAAKSREEIVTPALPPVGNPTQARDDSIRIARAAGVTQVPIGVAIGWRRGFGNGRGISAYAAPFYQWNRSGNSELPSSETFRWSVGLDVGLTSRLGVTVGAELGQQIEETLPGPWGSVFGIGVGWAFGRR